MLTSFKHFFIPCEENEYRPHSLRHDMFIIYIVVALVLKLGLISVLTFLPRSYFYADVTRLAIIAMTNDARRLEGLPALEENSLLAKAAQEKANDLVSKNYFAHESPDGKTPWYWFRQAGYRYLYAGENLAKDFVDSRAVVDAWLASPGHRANVMNGNYNEIGIAVAAGPKDASGHESIVVVQLFGKPQPSPKATVGTAQPSPKTAPVAVQPSVKPASPPKFTPAPTRTVTPAPSVAVSAKPTAIPATTTSPPPIGTPSPSATPQNDIAGIKTVTGSETAVLTSDDLNIAGAGVGEERISGPRGKFIFSARVMTVAENAVESFYILFLGFVLLAAVLNIFIRMDIQHYDLLLRAAVLAVFFGALILMNGHAFVDYRPEVI